MVKYIVKRLINLIPVIFIISILLFGMMKAMPADPVLLLMPQDPNILQDPARREKIYKQIEHQYGFDKSVPEQYVRWLGRVMKGELGESTVYKKPVKDVIGEPLRNTVILNFGSTIIAFVLSVIIGIKSAVRRGSTYDRFWQVISLIGISLPTFFIALMLIFFFALHLGWLPANGMPVVISGGAMETLKAWARTLVLPTITLTVGSLASTSRYVRNAMIDALSQDYVRTARSKGLSEKVVIYSHAFRNAMIPVVTVVAWSIVGMFGGAAITETIFAYHGIGQILISSVLAMDYNVVLALNMLYAVLMVLGNLLMDIGYAAVDPRIRLE